MGNTVEKQNPPKSVIQVRGLKKYFPVQKGLFSKVRAWVKAVDDVSFEINRGETFGLVGESGCGKTTITKCILLMEKPTAGTVFFDGHDITSLKGDDFVHYRRSIQVVFQDPTSALNPRMRVEDIVREPIIAHERMPRRVTRGRVIQVLEEVGLSPSSAQLFPHEFSGGQRQRIAIARALAPSPACIVFDEPVSALDVSIRAQILNLLCDLQKKENLTFLVIAHDLAVIKHVSTRIGVMYLGKLVEIADSEDLYARPLHPYTQALLSAALPSHPDQKRDEIILSGEVPSPLNPPSGCRFHPRCPYAKVKCSRIEPVLRDAGPGHKVACESTG